MAVITTDVLIEGVKRRDVFEWLGEPGHHERLLQGALDELQASGEHTWRGMLRVAPRKRPLTYRFVELDDSHGGRRVLCQIEGKRVAGPLRYSLRTPRASNATLVTLHHDYDPGGPLGFVLDQAGLRRGLEDLWAAVLARLDQELRAG